ncbi:hypothetical protein SAMN05444285_102221 [Draconibacterium orientale]|uniref:Uncharacterized protein n=2 Tax=Draconibacterium orientale TaxID=1168034 RepID=A0A1H9ZPG6_9BACT|nr:hypothetical protein [Draconibacterium orientale]SES83469.1 hypothetical protein SAMN05444285_102221 [Draconibacterium orientale]
MIKKNVMRVIMLIIAVNLISCDSIKKATEPEDIGMYAFELLKTLSQTTKSDYVNSFLTIEEIRVLGKNEVVVTDSDTRNELTSMPKEEWVEDIEDDYNELKQDGGENGIKWAEIEYLDFVYEMDNEGGIKVCEGELFFKYKEDSYSVDLAAIFDGTEYKLVELDYLEMQ